MSSERLAHETDISRDRLAHERAEAVRTTAASAFSASDAVVRHVNQNTVHTLARREESEFGARRAISKAMDGLAFVTAMGWSAEVRESAAMLLDEIDKHRKIDVGARRCNQEWERYDDDDGSPRGAGERHLGSARCLQKCCRRVAPTRERS